MKTVRERYIEINKRIFNHRDGEVLAIQKEYGMAYRKSFGVSVLVLQQIAADYMPSHELAKLFWEAGGREQLLMAAMLEEPKKVECAELEQYLMKMQTPELWEQITRQLLRHLPNADEIILSWLGSKRLQVFAILLLGYLPNCFTVQVLEKIIADNPKDGGYLDKCIYRILLKIGLQSESFCEILFEKLASLSHYQELLAELKDFKA